MNLEQRSSLSFQNVIARASAYTPGRNLDTISDAHGDTLLSPEAVSELNVEDMLLAETGLRNYLDGIGDSDDVSDRSRAAVVQRRLVEIALIRVNHGQVTGEIDQSGEIHAIQQLLYGHYNPDLFRAALRKKVELLEAIPTSPDIEVGKALLLDELDGHAVSGEHTVGHMDLEQPSEETLTAIGDWLRSQFEDIFDEIDALEGAELDAQKLGDILNMAIASTPALREYGWRAEIVKRNKPAITVFASSRLVVIPEQRRMSKADAKKLVVHEVFGHALRSAIAEMNGDEVGTTGTARYSEFEESLEIALEQCLDGKYDPRRGLDHYISIGLAETARLPREKIAKLTASMRQITLANDRLVNDRVDRVAQSTANQMRRTFAGMTDVDDGIAHRKDIDYLHGLNGAWRLLNAIVKSGQVDEGMNWLLSAKFNPFIALDQQRISLYAKMPSSVKDVLGV